MRTSTRRTLAIVLMVLFMAAPHAPALSAGAARSEDSERLSEYGADHLVVAGAIEPNWSAGARFEYLAYYPTNLQIHRGDVVFFRMDGFHTVTFALKEKERRSFLRRDEIEPVVSVAHHEPSDPGCGTSAEAPPCVLNRTDQYVNSGWNLADNHLKLAVDLPVGSYEYYCVIHAGMQGQIQVVPDSQPIATPDQVAAQRDAQVAADTANAQRTLDQPWPLAFEQIEGTDNRRYRVQAGAYTPDWRVAVNQYLPGSVEIEPGDEIEFFMPPGGLLSPAHPEPVSEAHTVSFPTESGEVGFLSYVNPACDADDVGSGLPGTPNPTALFVGCPGGMERELLLSPAAFQRPLRAPGNAVVTPASYHDSGIILPPNVPCRSGCDPWTEERLPSTTTSVFPAEGAYSYMCFLHGQVMAGSVQVASA